MLLPYSITINGDLVIQIDAPHFAWLPWGPRISRERLRCLVAAALRKHYRRRMVVKA